jgi:hypothetical protein
MLLQIQRSANKDLISNHKHNEIKRLFQTIDPLLNSCLDSTEQPTPPTVVCDTLHKNNLPDI